MKISACMITKNEEDNIAKSINSYKSIVDEIIVVDTGSTDRTVEVAKGLGAKVYYFEWIDDFAKAKNFAKNKAKGDWIIFLDADEYFDRYRAKNIPALIEKYGKNNTRLIGCNLINIDKETGTEVGRSTQTRIFKNSKDIYYKRPIHEVLNLPKNTNAHFLSEEELAIYHTGYSYDILEDKAKRNLSLLLKELEKDEIDPSIYYFLADTYIGLKEYELCIYYGEKFLDNRVNMPGYNSKVYQNIIVSMIRLKKDWDEIEKLIRKSIKKFPKHPMFYLLLGERYFLTKQYTRALENYKITIKLQENYNDIEINHLGGKIHEIEHTMARNYEYKNQEGKALELYIAALDKMNTYKPALKNLLKLIKNKSDVEIIEILEELYDKKDPEDLEFLIGELTKERYRSVLAYYVNTMLLEFNHQDFSLVIMLLTNGKYEQAYRHFYEAYRTNYEDIYIKLAIISGYLSENRKELLEPLRNIVRPSLKRIIEVILSRNTEYVLYKEDLNDYIDILIELISLKKESYIKEYLDMRFNFNEKIDGVYRIIGDSFKDNKCYNKAIDFYKEELEKDEKNQDYLNFSIGYCYYKMSVMKNALDYFERAIDEGYTENDIREFLSWIKEESNDEKIILLSENIIKNFNVAKK